MSPPMPAAVLPVVSPVSATVAAGTAAALVFETSVGRAPGSGAARGARRGIAPLAVAAAARTAVCLRLVVRQDFLWLRVVHVDFVVTQRFVLPSSRHVTFVVTHDRTPLFVLQATADLTHRLLRLLTEQVNVLRGGPEEPPITGVPFACAAVTADEVAALVTGGSTIRAATASSASAVSV
jgi:hypothetical protein